MHGKNPIGRRRFATLTAGLGVALALGVSAWNARPAQGSGGPGYVAMDFFLEATWAAAAQSQDSADLSRCLTEFGRGHLYACVFRDKVIPCYYWGVDFDLALNLPTANDFSAEEAWAHREAALLQFDKAIDLNPLNEMAWKARGFLYAATATALLDSDWLPTVATTAAVAETAANRERWDALIARLNAPAQADRQQAQRDLLTAGIDVEPALVRHLTDPCLEVRRTCLGLLAQVWREQAICDSLRAWQVHCENAAKDIQPGDDPDAERFKSEAGLNYLRLVRERGLREDEKALWAEVYATLSQDARLRLDPPPPEPVR